MNTWTKRIMGQSYPASIHYPTNSRSTPDYPSKKPTTDPQNHYQNLTWEDFNHNETLVLGYTSSTFIAYPKTTGKSPYSEYVLKSCATKEYTPERLRLVDISREIKGRELFLATLCDFRFEERMYIGSELSDISLEDIIYCTIQLNENHLSAILKQVVLALCYLHERTRGSGVRLNYGNLKASNVFLKRNGKVQLASFGSIVCPKISTPANHNKDLREVGDLMIHMMTQSSDQLDSHILRQRMLSGKATGKGLDASFEPSPEFLDYYEMCFSHEGNIRSLLKVIFFFSVTCKVS